MEVAEQNRKKTGILQKAGWFLASWSPLLFFMGIQMFTAFIAVIVSYIANMPQIVAIVMKNPENPDIMPILSQVMDGYMKNIIIIQIISQLLSVVCFVVWYYYIAGKPKMRQPSKVFKTESVVNIVCFGLGTEIFIAFILTLVKGWFPQAMAEYEELMKMAGIDKITVGVVLATVILAPIVEELVFRGCIMKMAEKMGLGFWVVNILQALAFGIAHMNWIQSSYAFLLGIVLGCIYQKYRSLWAPVLLHAVFNFTGTVITSLIAGIPVLNSDIGSVVLFVAASLVSIFFGIRIIREKAKLNAIA